VRSRGSLLRIAAAPLRIEAGLIQIEDALGQMDDALGQIESAPLQDASALGQKHSAPCPDQSALGQNQSALCPNRSAPGQNQSALCPDRSAPGQNQSALCPDQSAPCPDRSALGQNQSVLGSRRSASGAFPEGSAGMISGSGPPPGRPRPGESHAREQPHSPALPPAPQHRRAPPPVHVGGAPPRRRGGGPVHLGGAQVQLLRWREGGLRPEVLAPRLAVQDLGGGARDGQPPGHHAADLRLLGARSQGRRHPQSDHGAAGGSALRAAQGRADRLLRRDRVLHHRGPPAGGTTRRRASCPAGSALREDASAVEIQSFRRLYNLGSL
jgi:hypothetical protein